MNAINVDCNLAIASVRSHVRPHTFAVHAAHPAGNPCWRERQGAHRAQCAYVFEHRDSTGVATEIAICQLAEIDSTSRFRTDQALFRSRGVHVAGKSIYQPAKRAGYLRALPASSRGAAHLLFAQYDALSPVRDQAHKELRFVGNL